MKAALLHIGASGLQADTLLWAKECGLYVVATDRDANASSRHLADEFVNISGTDEIALLSLARSIAQQHRLIGVYCNSDFALPAAAKINEEFGLRGCSQDAVDMAVNKVAAKDLMSARNIAVPRGVVLASASLDTEDVGRLSAPLIVKPADSCGSQGVVYVHSPQDLDPAIHGAFDFSSHVVIEEFILGKGIDTIGIMKDGRLFPCGLGARFFSELPFRYPTHGFANAALSRAEQAEAFRVTEAAALAVGILDGPVKADLIFSQGHFHVIEVTPRFHGDVFTNKMIVYSFGFNPAKTLFRFFMTGEVPEYSILDLQPKSVLWKGLFPLVDNFDWSVIKSNGVQSGRFLDMYLDPRFRFSAEAHRDNTSLAGFLWLEFDTDEAMHQYVEDFKSLYDGILV